MTIGERATAWIEQHGIKQTHLAAQFRERAVARGKEVVLDTVASHISRLKKDELVAVRFFFADPTDEKDLLDVLDVPDGEREAWRADAGAVLAPEDRPIRVVVDLSDVLPGAELTRYAEALHAQIVMAAPRRMALVVTAEQREYLPPRCTPQDRVVIEVVPNANAGWSRVQALAKQGVTIVSQRTFDAIERWVAIEPRHHSPMNFSFEPPDALTRLAQDRAIDDDAVSSSARRTNPGEGHSVAPPQELTHSPCARRRLIADLYFGRPSNVSSRVRYGRPADLEERRTWGRALGVPVAATPEEWGRELLARATQNGLSLARDGDEATLSTERARVARGGSAPRGVRIGETLHLINPTAPLRDAMAGLHGVEIHEVAQRPSGFDRVRELIKQVPWETWFGDPYMDDAVARLDLSTAERDEVDFARAVFLLNDGLRSKAAPRLATWRLALAAALAENPPQVGLRVPASIRMDDRQFTLLPERTVATRKAARGLELVGIPALAPPRITRDTSLVALYAETSDTNSPTERQSHRFALSIKAALDNLDPLFELFDRSPSQQQDVHGANTDRWTASSLRWRSQEFSFAENFWLDADEMTAVCWIALRRAVCAQEGITLHDGRGMLEMGGGIVAWIVASSTEHPKDTPAQIDLWCTPRFQGGPYYRSEPYKPEPLTRSDFTAQVELGAARTSGERDSERRQTTGLANVPRELILTHNGTLFRISFGGTPWALNGRALKRQVLSAASSATPPPDDDYDYDDDE